MKPAFTDGNLNDIASRVIGGGDPRIAAVANLARDDWRRALAHAFHLTPGQQRNLAAIPAANVAQIQQAVIAALDSNGSIDVSFGANGTLDVAPGGGAGPNPDLKINILRCHFDADCGNWSCGPATPEE